MTPYYSAVIMCPSCLGSGIEPTTSASTPITCGRCLGQRKVMQVPVNNRTATSG